MAAFLEKSTGSEGFHQVIDFLSQSHISYALTKKPEIYISFIKQFWRTAEASTNTDGEETITAIIDGQSKTITEASLRRHLKLEDHDGITSIPNSEIFEQLALMGYHTDSDKPTKGYSGHKDALFPSMLNVSEPSTSPSRITSSPSYSPEPSIEHSPDHTTTAVSFPSPTQPTQPSPGAEQHIPTPNESPFHVVHSYGSAEGSVKLNELTALVTKLSEKIGVLEDDLKKTKQTYSSAFTQLILRIKKLEFKVKTGKARQRARVVFSEDEEDDSSKQGRKLFDAEVQEKASTETEPIIQEVTPTEVIQDQGSSEKGNYEVSTTGATKGTASEVPVVSTAEVNTSTPGRTVTYRRRTIRLQEQMDEEQRAQIARDEEIDRQWDEEKGERAMSEAKSSKKIDWNDPLVIRWRDAEKEELKGYLDIIPREDVPKMLNLYLQIHILLMQNGIAIHMLIEKKYPLSQAMISKMLPKRLEVDHESTQAYELLKFIRSQVQK
ncbi:hypothetical protein Tco_1205023 [Tanacetum coccineum]